MHTPGEKYKSTTLYKCLTATNSLHHHSINEEFRYVPNYNPSGTRYDAKHLDRFLTTGWGRAGSPVVEASTAMGNSTRSQEQLATSIFPNNARERRANPFLIKARAKSIMKEPAYLRGTINDFTFKEVKNNTAVLLAGTEMDSEKIKVHYKKEFGLLEKNFDQSKLEYSDQPSPCAIPYDRRAQLVETKKNQVELANWKARKNEVSFKMRVYKNTFRTGSLGVDNPMNESSLLYKDEFEKMKKVRDESAKIEARRSLMLKDMAKSNSMIEFFNKNFDKKTALPVKKILEANTRKIVTEEFTDKWKNSTNRLFKQPMKRYSIQRANYIRNQETKGRDWNILSFADNTVDVKVMPPLDS